MTDNLIGKRALVRLSSAPDDMLNGTVLYRPQTIGDCWIIRDDAGCTFYVQSYQWVMFRLGDDLND